MDACPGRVNLVSFQSEFDTVHYPRPGGIDQSISTGTDYKTFGKLKNGVTGTGVVDRTKYAYTAWLAEGYRGQCSEFCGVGHGFMPIVVHTVPLYYMFHTMDFFWFDFQTHYF
jgi:hypothetical protein